MKKIIPFFALVLLLASCQKDPDLSEVDGNFVVYTDHDASANFASYGTYYLPDSVLLISNSITPVYWKSSEATTVLKTFQQNMDARGYTRVADKADADLGVQVSYVQDVSYFADYYDYPYWWWGYPYYWYPYYWGDWGGWYYPYTIVYSYEVGSILGELVDLKNSPKGGSDAKLTVLWTSYEGGLLSGSTSIDTNLATTAINQAFAQSPYIQK